MLTFFKFHFLLQIYSSFKICKLAKILKKVISANLNQKCMILCSKILNVLQNLGLTVLLPWQHTGFQTSPTLKAFLATFGVPFSYYFANGASYTRSNKHINIHVSLSLWPCLTFCELKITYILKSSGWGLKRVSCHENKMFYGRRCVFCRTISLPSFNDLT